MTTTNSVRRRYWNHRSLGLGASISLAYRLGLPSASMACQGVGILTPAASATQNCISPRQPPPRPQPFHPRQGRAGYIGRPPPHWLRQQRRRARCPDSGIGSWRLPRQRRRLVNGGHYVQRLRNGTANGRCWTGLTCCWHRSKVHVKNVITCAALQAGASYNDIAEVVLNRNVRLIFP